MRRGISRLAGEHGAGELDDLNCHDRTAKDRGDNGRDGRIDIAFGDGRAETILQKHVGDVRIPPMSVLRRWAPHVLTGLPRSHGAI